MYVYTTMSQSFQVKICTIACSFENSISCHQLQPSEIEGKGRGWGWMRIWTRLSVTLGDGMVILWACLCAVAVRNEQNMNKDVEKYGAVLSGTKGNFSKVLWVSNRVYTLHFNKTMSKPAAKKTGLKKYDPARAWTSMEASISIEQKMVIKGLNPGNSLFIPPFDLHKYYEIKYNVVKRTNNVYE